MEITVGRTVNISNPSPEIKAWCKKNLTIPNPDYGKKVRMNLWLGNTPRNLTMYEEHGNMLILPFGVLRDIQQFMREGDMIQSCFADKQEVEYHCKVPLYDYQETAVDELIKAQYGILQSPTGSGKTQIGVALIARLRLKALWVTHTRDLMRQSKNRAEQYMDKKLIGTITEGKVSIGSGVTFSTVQTLSRLNLKEYEHCWDVIVVDECHHVAGSPTSITQFYKVLNSLSARHKYGLSATPKRSDGLMKATFALLGNVVFSVPVEAVGDKIMKVGILPCLTGITVSEEMQDTDGTLDYVKMLVSLTSNTQRNAVIVNRLIAERNHPSLILSDRLEHLENMMSLLPSVMQKEAVKVSGKDMRSKANKAARDKAIEDMRRGRKKYLFATYALAREGLDIPRLERLYLTTPIRKEEVVTQCIGRVARTFKSKTEAICYDFVDDFGYLFRAYKKRCTTYRKVGCYFIGGETNR